MTNIFVVGISHRTASIDIREKVFLRPLERELLLGMLRSDPLFQEGMILSTCNRTEIYVSAVTEDLDKDIIIDLLLNIKKIADGSDVRRSFYCYSGEDCLRHLLRVITGLDSVVLGEKQILGQVKEAVELSRSKGMFLKQFNILSDVAIRAGKKAQRETDISCGGGSVSWAAVNAAQNIISTLKNKSVLIIGAGKMSALTAEQLRNKQIKQLYVTNRTKDKAEALARRLGGEAVLFMDLKGVLSKVDLCISSVSAAHYVLGHDLMQKVMEARGHKQLVIVDISTPRTIDPQVNRLKGVRLLTVDDLGDVLKENMDRRKASVQQVEVIIRNKLIEFNIKMSKQDNFAVKFSLSGI